MQVDMELSSSMEQQTGSKYEKEYVKAVYCLDMEQQTGSKYEKEYVKAVYCHPAYLTYMQSTS